MKIEQKIIATFAAIIMCPMLSDSPEQKDKGYFQLLFEAWKAIWTSKEE